MGTNKDYTKLVAAFPLRSIRNDAELAAATKVLHDLLKQPQGPGWQDYVDTLTDLIDVYEKKNHPIPDASQAEVLKFLIESNRIRQIDLSRETKIRPATISALARNVRKMTPTQAKILADRFGISPAAFLPAKEKSS